MLEIQRQLSPLEELEYQNQLPSSEEDHPQEFQEESQSYSNQLKWSFSVTLAVLLLLPLIQHRKNKAKLTITKLPQHLSQESLHIKPSNSNAREDYERLSVEPLANNEAKLNELTDLIIRKLSKIIDGPSSEYVRIISAVLTLNIPEFKACFEKNYPELGQIYQHPMTLEEYENVVNRIKNCFEIFHQAKQDGKIIKHLEEKKRLGDYMEARRMAKNYLFLLECAVLVEKVKKKECSQESFIERIKSVLQKEATRFRTRTQKRKATERMPIIKVEITSMVMNSTYYSLNYIEEILKDINKKVD